ncbi:hypothetical protein Adt_35589 [Abeliophyllum distichum]|uniref:Uncharacterized protein n=1 Tax=Abeliophyllum distichum TaxID=126358 RepID=A0ABD1QFC1_9LAMI
MPSDLLALDVIDDQVATVLSPHDFKIEVERSNARKAVKEQLHFSNNQEPALLIRSGRTIQLSSRYLLHEESFKAISTLEDVDPTLYTEAVEDVDVEHWRRPSIQK